MEEVRFVLTAKDCQRFLRFVAFHRYYTLLAFFGFICRVLAVDALIFFILNTMPSYVPIILSALFTVFLVFQIFSAFKKTVTQSAEDAEKVGVLLLQISEQGFRQQSAQIDTIVPWQGIEALRQDKHNLYILTDRAHVSGTVIPRHAFAHAEDAERFLSLAYSYWQGSDAQNHSNLF